MAKVRPRRDPRDPRAKGRDGQGIFGFFRARLLPRPVAAPPPPVGHRASVAGRDEALTRQAAELLRGVGCDEAAARVAVCWSPRLTSTAGLAKPARGLVVLNPRLREFAGEVDRTLRHEVAHLAVAAKARGRRVAAHGPEWRGACAALGIPGESRCHTLPLPRQPRARPHVYRCPGCGCELRRVRPIKPRARLACRECCQRHAGGRFDARFEFVKAAK